mmetsp:Transcript_5262/g.5621  ORF Transcript_5262/g.5621 Transcript_5262/m.5621 type:complete len:130 (+) Transcript_5262:148-537(+)
MIRRTGVLLSKAKKRTIVRDPRKVAAKKKKGSRTSAATATVVVPQQQQQQQQQQPPPSNYTTTHLPIETQQQQHQRAVDQYQHQLPAIGSNLYNQQSTSGRGSVLLTYALLGVGVSMGVTLVGALFGGF